jgi:transposase
MKIFDTAPETRYCFMEKGQPMNKETFSVCRNRAFHPED